jgi:hypothetical protein
MPTSASHAPSGAPREPPGAPMAHPPDEDVPAVEAGATHCWSLLQEAGRTQSSTELHVVLHVDPSQL